MSHVDDGLLHAYLDGEVPADAAARLEAHVAECAACRARLEEERALIRRASELLALVEPPARDVPPFRAGDPRPPVRLWWQVRFPLAWAATVILALGVGWLLGGVGGLARAPAPGVMPLALPESAARGAPPAPVASEPKAALRPRQSERRTPATPRQPEQVAASAVADSIQVAMKVTPEVRQDLAGAMARLAAPQPASISPDSARALLGADLLALPDVPIESIRRIPAPGETVIVVQQPLDSSTTIELVHRRPTALSVDGVVMSDAAAAQRERVDSTRVPARAIPGAAKLAVRAPEPAPVFRYYFGRAPRVAGGVTMEIRGPLPVDSLQRLLDRAQPIP